MTRGTEQLPRVHGRLASIQVMRGVAATLVVLVHAIDVVVGTDRIGRSRIAGFGHIADLGAIGVDLFFVISGFVMALTAGRLAGARGARNFLLLRWARIAPPYLVICAVIVLAQGMLGPQHDWPAWRSIFNAVLFIPVADVDGYTVPPLDVGWTLSFEFTFYLLVAVMVLFGLARRLLILAGVLVVSGVIGASLAPRPFMLSWLTNPILIEFALGIVAYSLWRSGVLSRGRLIQVGLGAAAATALVVELFVGFPPTDVLRDAPSAMSRVLVWGVPVFFIFVALLPTAPRPSSRAGWAGMRVGNASYSIYLVHPLLFLFADRVVARLPHWPIADAVVVAGVLGGVVLGLLYYRLVERPLTEGMRTVLSRALGVRPHLQPDSAISSAAANR